MRNQLVISKYFRFVRIQSDIGTCKSSWKMENFNGTSNNNPNSFSVSGLVPTLFTFTLILCYVKFQWDRRRLMELASKIQGPTSYPIVGNLVDFLSRAFRCGDRNIATFELMSRSFDHFPDVVKLWMGPELIVGIAKPEYLEIAMNSPNCLEKGFPYKFIKDYLGDGLLTAPVHIWKKNRKRINPTFNQRNLDSFVEIFNDESKNLAKFLEQKVSDEIIDIFHIVSAHNLDTVFETLIRFKGEASERDRYGKLIDRAMEIMTKRIFSLWFHSNSIFKMSSYYSEFVQVVAKMKNFADQVIHAKQKECELLMKKVQSGEVIAEGDNRNNFLNLLIHMNYDGEEITDEQLQDEFSTFIAAGSDTTAASVCFCMLTLGMHPEFQQKVHEELIDVLGNDNREITASDLPKLQYLERVIKETLRLFPIAPFIFRKPAIEIDLGDVVIPAGCSLVMSIFNLHRNPALWKDPLVFNPDNFLPQEISKRHPYAFLPFSGGPRNCIGSKYAMMVMKTFLANIVRKFHIKCGYKSIEEIELKVNILMRPVDGFKVSIQLRK